VGFCLIIAELALVSFGHFRGDFLLRGHIVGVLDEAIVLRVLLPASLELHGHPALDGAAHVLLG
jgi:hypothetical protein